MKKIKVYHENGKVKITRFAPTGIEQVMYSDLKDGESVEIILDFELAVQTKKEIGVQYV